LYGHASALSGRTKRKLPPIFMAGTYAETAARGHGQQSGRRANCSTRPPTDPDVQDYCIRLLKHHHSLPILLKLCRACLVRPFVGSMSVRSFRALRDDVRLPLPYSGSLGPRFATYQRYYGVLRRLSSVSTSSGCPLSADTLRCLCSSVLCPVTETHHHAQPGELFTRFPLTT